MSISTVKENLAYSKELLEAGIDGANTARKGSAGGVEATTDLVTSAAGIMATGDDRRPGGRTRRFYQTAPIRRRGFGGLLARFWFAGSFAWKTRLLTSAMAHTAGKRITQVRDGHWFSSKHPDQSMADHTC